MTKLRFHDQEELQMETYELRITDIPRYVVFRSIIFLVCSLEHFLRIIDLQTVHFTLLLFEFIFWQIEQCDIKWVRLDFFVTRLGLFDFKKLKNWVLVRSKKGNISLLQHLQNQGS